jgi:prepilin-type N-terminal cleavage/methylation domain-containing protein
MAEGHGARGFSLVELLIATALMGSMMSVIFQLLNPADGAFRAQPEAADVQQRLRVAVDTLTRDLVMAGAGTSQGRDAGPLIDFMAPVLPLRQGRRRSDIPGTSLTDTITVIRASAGAAQTTIAQPLAAQSTSVQVNLEPGCPPGDAVCGFRTGMDVLVFDGTGAYQLFTISSIDGFALTLQHNLRDSSRVYAASRTRIVQAVSRTYFLKADSVAKTYQLMQYNGAGGQDVPVVDHVVGLRFEYFGDPQPPLMRQPLTAATGPWTTYGPTPTGSGENCVFAANGTPTSSPRLPVLGDGTGLVQLAHEGFTDGPWCPDEVDPNRYDADLLRIRRIVVVLRVQSAMPALRGPVGQLFAHAGTSKGGGPWVPDQEIRFDLTPRNLNLRR